MLNIKQFRDLIKCTLNDLLIYSEFMEELLVFTCAAESVGGSYIKEEHGNGLGIYFMTPSRYNVLWQNFITQKPILFTKLSANFDVVNNPSEDRLIYDLKFSTAMAALYYTEVRQIYCKNIGISRYLNINFWEVYFENYNKTMLKDIAIRRYHDFISKS